MRPSRRIAAGQRKQGRGDAVVRPRSMGSRKTRRRPRRPGAGPAERRWRHIAHVEPSRRIVRPRRRNDDSARDKGDRVECRVAVGDDTKSAIAVMVRMCGKPAAIIGPRVAIFSRRSDRRADVAVRESAVSRRGDDEAQSLGQNEAHERGHRKPARQSLRIQPKRSHSFIGSPGESDVNGSGIKYLSCCSNATRASATRKFSRSGHRSKRRRPIDPKRSSLLKVGFRRQRTSALRAGRGRNGSQFPLHGPELPRGAMNGRSCGFHMRGISRGAGRRGRRRGAVPYRGLCDFQ